MVKLLKTRWKLNVLDIIIILAAILALGVVFMLLNADRGGITLSKGKPIDITYTLQLSNVEPDLLDVINEGDKVIETVEKHTIGTITGMTTEPYKPTTNNYADGGKVLSVVPDRYFVNLTIAVTVRDNGQELSVDGFAIRANSTMSVSGPRWAAQGLVTQIVR